MAKDITKKARAEGEEANASHGRTKRKRKKAKDMERERPEPQKLCCCDPKARVYIDTRVTSVWVENRMEERRRLQARADAAASVNPPPPDVVSDGAGGSEIDVTTRKDQGKVYRTDCYTIHWQAEGPCRPFGLVLHVRGEVEYLAECIPEEGEVSLSRSYLLEPPDYQPPGPGFVSATLVVKDCADRRAECTNRVSRP